MIIQNVTKTWAMPSGKTFTIKPIQELILDYMDELIVDSVILDPFANEASIKELIPEGLEYISNDIDTSFDTDYHLNALEFLQKFDDNSIDMILYDPPYSFRHVSECYKKLKMTVTAKDTSNAFFANFKKEIARIMKVNGLVITCGWNSNGIPNNLGFETQEILLVAHGSNHNDTIITVDRKVKE